MSGSKILFSQMESLRFIDSLSLFMQPLASLCKSFNITETKKGFFPHKFNIPNNQNYVGPIPALDYYDPEMMKPSMAVELTKWHEQQINHRFVFDFKKEIIEYCRSDVQILVTAMLRFTKLFQSITGLNPITRSFTLASVAMEVFRAKMLPKFTLGITPITGYGFRKQSIIGNAWLDLMQRNTRTRIFREYRLGPYYADGFRPQTKEVFEFWGCMYHGCIICFPGRVTILELNGGAVSVKV